MFQLDILILMFHPDNSILYDNHCMMYEVYLHHLYKYPQDMINIQVELFHHHIYLIYNTYMLNSQNYPHYLDKFPQDMRFCMNHRTDKKRDLG